jgi:predicted Rossmann fold nucleotide-binding protein DprA/Smf involved in DNA uptake
MSAGCHRLLREGAACITDATEVMELLGVTVWA